MKMKKLKSLCYHNVSTDKFEDILNFKKNAKNSLTVKVKNNIL